MTSNVWQTSVTGTEEEEAEEVAIDEEGTDHQPPTEEEEVAYLYVPDISYEDDLKKMFGFTSFQSKPVQVLLLQSKVWLKVLYSSLLTLLHDVLLCWHSEKETKAKQEATGKGDGAIRTRKLWLLGSAISVLRPL